MDHPGLRAFQDRLIDRIDVRGSHRTVWILDESSQFRWIGSQRDQETSKFFN
ncbi:MAG: hypothetical protein QOJ84_64 [Bradyrhizobium sp.]|jgi:hypothetical protein|nr:hypothetical protein [Bradyrhizobium sp.]